MNNRIRTTSPCPLALAALLLSASGRAGGSAEATSTVSAAPDWSAREAIQSAINDTNHAEGLGTHRLLIENNRIEECGFSWNRETNPHWQAISIFAQLQPFRLASIPGFHRNVTIRNNTVLGTPRGFLLQGIDGLVVEENTFQPGSDQSPVGVPLNTEGSNVPGGKSRGIK